LELGTGGETDFRSLFQRFEAPPCVERMKQRGEQAVKRLTARKLNLWGGSVRQRSIY
jgi:hypothetical protein